MMGLGWRRISRRILRPRFLSPLRRPDENLSDAIVLGGIFAFCIGFGVVAVLGPVTDPYDTFVSFSGALLLAFAVFCGVLWFSDMAPAGARIVLMLTTLVAIVMGTGSIYHRQIEGWGKALAFVFAAYCVFVLIVALVQLPDSFDVENE